MADDFERRTENVVKRFVDMGDGSWAELVVVVNEDGTPVGGGGGTSEVTLSDETLGSILSAEDFAHFNGDRGYAVLAVRNDAGGNLVSDDGDYGYLQIDAEGRLRVSLNSPGPGTGGSSSVANAIDNVQVLAANTGRKGATIYNDDTADTGARVNIALGFAASATDFTVQMGPQDYYEVPFGFTGVINRWALAATGDLRITEITE